MEYSRHFERFDGYTEFDRTFDTLSYSGKNYERIFEKSKFGWDERLVFFFLLFIILLSLILLFSISCGQINTTYVGIWLDSKDNTEVMTINADGSITIDVIGKVVNIIKKSDTNFVMQYNKK